MLRPYAFLAALAACLACTQSDPSARPASASAGNSGASGPAGTASPASPTTPADSAALLARADSGRIQGSPAAPVWVIVASDFQCPFCRRWHAETYPMIVRDYVRTGRVRMAYLNFPLRNHRHAVRTAEAAMCASLQGRFWPMHDVIFETQERWSPLEDGEASALIDSLAGAVGADVAAWRGCMNSHVTLPLIQGDLQRTVAAGIQSTPSFFIGDRALLGAQPPDSFRVAIERALARAAGR